MHHVGLLLTLQPYSPTTVYPAVAVYALHGNPIPHHAFLTRFAYPDRAMQVRSAGMMMSVAQGQRQAQQAQKGHTGWRTLHGEVIREAGVRGRNFQPAFAGRYTQQAL